MGTRITTSSDFRETGYSAPMPDWDLDVNRIFEMIVGQVQVTPPPLDGIEVIDLRSLDSQELGKILIFDSLRHFDCFKKMGATEANVLEEAIKKNHVRIVNPLLARVSPHELGRAFTLACAHERLDMVELMVADGRINPKHLGEGFKIVCDLGYPELAAELKNNSRLTQVDRDEGFRLSYQEKHTVVMEVVADKASSAGIGQVFIEACKDKRMDVAQRFLNDPRLKLTDLKRGLDVAERNGFDLKAALSSTTRIQFFLYKNSRPFIFGGLLIAGIAGAAFFQRRPTVILLPDSLRMTANLYPFFAVDRGCSLK